MRTHYNILQVGAALALIFLSLAPRASIAEADDYIPAIFHGRWVAEDSALRAAIVREHDVHLIFEDHFALCVVKESSHNKPGLFRSSHSVHIRCRGADMARLRIFNALRKTRLTAADVEWDLYLSEEDRGFEISMTNCLQPFDDNACPKDTLFRGLH